jgi:hypothetical protein
MSAFAVLRARMSDRACVCVCVCVTPNVLNQSSNCEVQHVCVYVCAWCYERVCLRPGHCTIIIK